MHSSPAMPYRIIDNELERCQDWLGDRTGGVGYDVLQAIGLERDGELVAVAGYNAFAPLSCHMHFAMDRGAYPPKEFVWFIYYYPFVQANCAVVIGIISDTNDRIIRLTEHVGYKERCRIPEAGLIVKTLNKEDCRFIRGSHGWK